MWFALLTTPQLWNKSIVLLTTCSNSSTITDRIYHHLKAWTKFQIAISDACASSWVTREETGPSFDWPQKRYVDIEQQQVERVTVIISFWLRLSGRQQRFTSANYRSPQGSYRANIFSSLVEIYFEVSKTFFPPESRDDWLTAFKTAATMCSDDVDVAHLMNLVH